MLKIEKLSKNAAVEIDGVQLITGQRLENSQKGDIKVTKGFIAFSIDESQLYLQGEDNVCYKATLTDILTIDSLKQPKTVAKPKTTKEVKGVTVK